MAYDHQSPVESSPALQRNDNPNPHKQPAVEIPAATPELLAIRHAQEAKRDAVAGGDALTSQPPFRK